MSPGAPDKTALVVGERSLTFAGLERRIGQVRGMLRAAGLQPGDRIAAMLPNGVEFFEAGLGAAAAGCPVVPVNWHLKRDELAWVISDSGARLLIAHAARTRGSPPARS